MFLGLGGWLGIDIGPIGAAVLCAALWLLLVHSSKHADEAFPADKILNSALRPSSLATVANALAKASTPLRHRREHA